MKKVNIALVGATGMVGRTILKVLDERNFPFDALYCFASDKSAGESVKCKGKDFHVEALTSAVFERNIDIVFFSAGSQVSRKYGPIAASKGIIVIDNSAEFRMDEHVPLVVPEVNSHALKKHNNIISNPNCSTIQAMVALKPLHDMYGIKRLVISTYQAVSGSGIKGFEDLSNGLKGIDKLQAYPHSIYNNCLPHIDVFQENGYTKEEMKIIEETNKILEDPKIKVTATAVRVPIFNCHSESINVELKKDFKLDDIFKLYSHSEGIILQDNPKQNIYPLASKSNNTDQVYIGRIRRDFSINRGLNIWLVADNIRKGAATNAIQIAEKLIED